MTEPFCFGIEWLDQALWLTGLLCVIGSVLLMTAGWLSARYWDGDE